MNLKFFLLLAVALLPARAYAQSTDAPPYSIQLYLCMGETDGTDAATLDCLLREFRYQDSRINGTYQSLLGGLPLAKRPALQRVQNLWWRYRDANCRLLRDTASDDRIGAIAQLNCMMDMTARRADDLESQLP
ncbi:lysozyme inhibitor LprI family protein [Pseudoxanthomonas dokdonensis]|uniref:Lysozyme inhibitor LprI-like N-terminal domain-containing protein n=1 Tax=Pseudoxanthomonas dokdonensis TaxID=344882 RepID=A0A0R0CZX8_9GAMM|nr:lysozyme inhibitor LprI family protein [Pseudoxanthomonas dokdonensis]KRG71687.1 hypothetical protein ABB29_02805 [Pseudoxanthomonas dokdonensis]